MSLLNINLIIHHKHSSNINMVHIWCGILFYLLLYIEWFLVWQYLLFINVLLTKKVKGASAFSSPIMSFISGRIFRGNSPMIVVSPYSQS